MKKCKVCGEYFEGRPHVCLKCKEKISKEYFEGKSSCDLCKEYDINPTTILGYIRECGHTPRTISEAMTPGVRKRISKTMKITMTKQRKKEISNAVRQAWTPERRMKMSRDLLGKPCSEETKQKISEANKGKPGFVREFHPNWLGEDHYRGPYCEKFNKEFKERVRKFFNYECGLCGRAEEENKKKLSVHHVTYDKKICCNDNLPLFIPLCLSCHMKTNFNRNYWHNYFTNYIMIWNDGECYMEKEI